MWGAILGGLLAGAGSYMGGQAAAGDAKKAYKYQMLAYYEQTAKLRDMLAHPEKYGLSDEDVEVMKASAEIPIRGAQLSTEKALQEQASRQGLLNSGAYMAALAEAKARAGASRGEAARSAELEKARSIANVKTSAGLATAGVSTPVQPTSTSSSETTSNVLAALGNLLASTSKSTQPSYSYYYGSSANPTVYKSTSSSTPWWKSW